jgi:hypothetical protein
VAMDNGIYFKNSLELFIYLLHGIWK